MTSNQFIIHGMHITENLQHHKTADVRRILEEKGFTENPSAEGDVTHFYPPAGSLEDQKQTTITFVDNFVAKDGIRHTD
jgi:hypothetical protein